MKFVSFASSSKGNCALISYKNTNLLIDCGISRKRIISNLEEYNLTLNDIDCILVTHSHFDHISGLPMLLKYNDIPVMGLRETLLTISSIMDKNNVSVNLNNFKIARPVNILNSDSYITVKDIIVYPLKGCHDVPSLYYKFKLGDEIVAILTDMGKYNENVIRNLDDVSYLMLECNYDNELLMASNRTEELKARIAGEFGHLSNVDCCKIIEQLTNKKLKHVYLSHISDDTNSEKYAYEFVTNYFKNSVKKQEMPLIHIAKRLEMTEIIND